MSVPIEERADTGWIRPISEWRALSGSAFERCAELVRSIGELATARERIVRNLETGKREHETELTFR